MLISPERHCQRELLKQTTNGYLTVYLEVCTGWVIKKLLHSTLPRELIVLATTKPVSTGLYV